MVLGIDLGTTNTLAASINNDGTPFLIPDIGRNLVSNPSLVIIDGGLALVSNFAKEYSKVYSNKLALNTWKRSFGTTKPVFIDHLGNEWYSETIAAIMLKKIIHDARLSLGENIDSIVITVPAHFNDLQRKSVLDAATLAEIKVEALIEEPVAAAISYLDKNAKKDEIILVYDFGGGTFDVAILTSSENQVFVLAKDGVSNIGGKEFDSLIAVKIKKLYESTFLKNFPTDNINLSKLLQDAEAIKIKICEKGELITSWLVYEGNILQVAFSPDELEVLSQQIIIDTEKIVFRCLKSIGIALENIDKFIMVGGTSNIPFLKKYWTKKMTLHQKIILYNPHHSISLGAAIFANSIIGQKSTILPIQLNTVSTFGIMLIINKSGNKDVLIPKSIKLPATSKRIVNTSKLSKLEFDMYQFWDIGDEFLIGSAKLENIEICKEIEISVTYKSDGIVGLKLIDTAKKKELRFSFFKEYGNKEFNMAEQKKLLTSKIINNII